MNSSKPSTQRKPTDMKEKAIRYGAHAAKLAARLTGYARRAHIRAQWRVIVAQHPAISPFITDYLKAAGAM